MFRGMFEKATNTDLCDVSDSEMLDCFSYTVFPNCSCFRDLATDGLSFPTRPARPPRMPLRSDVPAPHAERWRASGTRRADPPDTRAIIQGGRRAWTQGFGGILDQDTDNLFLQQEGIEASAKRGLTLGNYQEIRVRHFEKAVDKYMAMEPTPPGTQKLSR